MPFDDFEDITVFCRKCGKSYTFCRDECEDPSDEDCPHCGAARN